MDKLGFKKKHAWQARQATRGARKAQTYVEMNMGTEDEEREAVSVDVEVDEPTEVSVKGVIMATGSMNKTC